MTQADFEVVLANSAGEPVFVFSGREVPEVISWGGEQKLAVHELVGGGRMVDALGQQPKALEWSGLLLGSDALQRAQALDALRQRAEVLTLSWSRLRYLVVLRSFSADFQRWYQLPYHLDFEVVQDLNALPPVVLELALDDQVQADMRTLSTLATAQNNAALNQGVGSLQAAINAVSSFAGATQSQIASVLGPVQALRTLTRQLLASANNTIINLTSLGGVFPNNPLARNANALLNHVNTVNSASQLVQLDAVLGRLGANVAASGSGVKTVKQNGGSLYDLAVQQYGDATQWTAIAQANGLSDPQVQGTQTLVIPATPAVSGGVLSA